MPTYLTECNLRYLEISENAPEDVLNRGYLNSSLTVAIQATAPKNEKILEKIKKKIKNLI